MNFPHFDILALTPQVWKIRNFLFNPSLSGEEARARARVLEDKEQEGSEARCWCRI